MQLSILYSSLFESLHYQEDFAAQYRYMDNAEADKLFKELVSSSSVNAYPLLNEEARKTGNRHFDCRNHGEFYEHMPSMGRMKNVAVQLDSIAQKSIIFTRSMPAASEPDRGLVSIHSVYPIDNNEHHALHQDSSASMARSLAEAKNYQNAYYYVIGDVDFATSVLILFHPGYR